MSWFRRASEPEEVNNRSVSIGDPAVADLFGLTETYSGETVTDSKALQISAFWRGVNLIAGTIASLPLRSLVEAANGTSERTNSWLDNPSGNKLTGPTQFEWVESIVLSLIIHGNAYLYLLRNGAGAITGAQVLPPGSVTIERDDAFNKVFRITVADGQITRTENDVLHIPGPIMDGDYGLSVLEVARNGLGISLSADRAAARTFKNGASMSVLVTADEDVSEDEATTIATSLRNKMAGADNAGGMSFVNRKLKLTPWSMTLADAQFLESRQFQVEEIARWLGIPPHLLMQSEKSTSWGTGIEEQNRGLARHTLMPITTRIEQRLTRAIPDRHKAEFDYSGYLKPSPEDEIQLLIQQTNAGLLTVNEARRIRNMPSLPASTGADMPRIAPGATDPRLIEKEVSEVDSDDVPNPESGTSG